MAVVAWEHLVVSVVNMIPPAAATTNRLNRAMPILRRLTRIRCTRTHFTISRKNYCKISPINCSTKSRRYRRRQLWPKQQHAPNLTEVSYGKLPSWRQSPPIYFLVILLYWNRIEFRYCIYLTVHKLKLRIFRNVEQTILKPIAVQNVKIKIKKKKSRMSVEKSYRLFSSRRRVLVKEGENYSRSR